MRALGEEVRDVRLGMSISISAAEHLFELCDNKDKDGDGSRFMQGSRASR